MKQNIKAYFGLGFFALLFLFLIWGLINLLTNFSIEINGMITFLTVIIPHAISLAYIGFNLVVYILKVRDLNQPGKVVDKKETKS